MVSIAENAVLLRTTRIGGSKFRVSLSQHGELSDAITPKRCAPKLTPSRRVKLGFCRPFSCWTLPADAHSPLRPQHQPAAASHSTERFGVRRFIEVVRSVTSTNHSTALQQRPTQPITAVSSLWHTRASSHHISIPLLSAISLILSHHHADLAEYGVCSG